MLGPAAHVPPPPPEDGAPGGFEDSPSGRPTRKRKRKNGTGDKSGSGGGASAAGQTVALSDPEILAASRRITGQRVTWSWLVDSGASEDIASARDTIKSRILTKALESLFPFEGVGGTVFADDAIRDLCIEELGLNFCPSVVKCPYNLLSFGMRCQENGMDFIWLGSRKMLPYFICKDGSAVVLRVG